MAYDDASQLLVLTVPAAGHGCALVTWTWDSNQKIDQLWSARYAQNGPAITVTNESWNAAIPPGAKLTDVGFNATYSGQNRPPTNFYLNGTLCK